MGRPKKQPIVKEDVHEIEVEKKLYNLEVKVNDVVFKTESKTIKEGLAEFINSSNFPLGAKTRMFITYSLGNKRRHRIYSTSIARRLLLSMKKKDSVSAILAANLSRDIE